MTVTMVMRLTDARGMAVAGITKSLTEICALDEVKKDTEVTRNIVSNAQLLQALDGENLDRFALTFELTADEELKVR